MRFLFLILLLSSELAIAAKYVKNTSVVQKVWNGNQVNAGVCFLIPSNEELEFYQDSGLLADIVSADAVMSKDASCTNNITTISNAIAFLAGESLKDADGAVLSRIKVTETGWSYHFRSFEVETCTNNGSLELEANGSNSNFVTLKWYNSDNEEITQGFLESDNDFQTRLNSVCAKTIADWTPTWDYEILGGQLRQITPPVNDVRVWIIGVPTIPDNLGGSKVFINNANLKFMAQSEVLVADGRTPKKLLYNNPVPGSNTMRFQLSSTVMGVRHKLQISVEVFKK